MDFLWLKFLDSFNTEVNEYQNIFEFMCFVSSHKVFYPNYPLCSVGAFFQTFIHFEYAHKFVDVFQQNITTTPQ